MAVPGRAEVASSAMSGIRTRAAGAVAFALTVCAPVAGQAHVTAASPMADATPAVRYANLDAATCEAELTRRGAAFTPVDKARGVLAPIRLTGPLRGVSFHSGLPASQRAGSPFEILDCRLALALDDFALILAKHAVVEVVHLSMYRPPPRLWPDGRPSAQHGGGLAIDAGQFRKADGTVLDVNRDFAGYDRRDDVRPTRRAAKDGFLRRAPEHRVRGWGRASLQCGAFAQLQQETQKPLSPRGHRERSLVPRALTQVTHLTDHDGNKYH